MGVRRIAEQRVIPQARDVLLFERLCDFGYLSTNEVADFVFHVSQPVAFKRLWRLHDWDFLNLISRKASVGANIFCPNLNAVRDYVRPLSLARAKRSVAAHVWTRSHFRHEETSRRVALRILSNFPSLTVDLDHLLFQSDWEGDYHDSGTGKVPDFILKENGKAIGVFEIELSQKSKLRYFKIFNRLILNAKCPIVYLCGSPTIAASVADNYKQVSTFLEKRESVNPPKLIVKLVDEVSTRDGLWGLVMELLEGEGCKGVLHPEFG